MRDADIAVNRVSQWAVSAMDDPKWHSKAGKTFVTDLIMLVAVSKSALAEHPADEDEPITAEWFATEFKNQIDGVHIDICDTMYLFIHHRVVILGAESTERNCSIYRLDLPHIKTRGQLRNLIRLLKGTTL